jgi:DNA-binding NtrC family response regulator
VTVALPPLRERREDIPLLLEHFLAKFAERNGKVIGGLTPQARDALLRYDYPGNVRELENVVERAVVLTRDDVIGLRDLPLSLTASGAEPAESGSLPAAVEALERRLIREALAGADGVQTRAAEALGLTERGLRYKLRKYGLAGS